MHNIIYISKSLYVTNLKQIKIVFIKNFKKFLVISRFVQVTENYGIRTESTIKILNAF